jgi:oligo-1,6-glucosidase/alpha-glucosidase
MLLLTLRGTPTLYQGDEIGIGEVVIPPDRVRDPQDLRQPGLGIGRDRSRTPIPWDASAYAGFSNVDPWLPLNEDWRVRNVAAQLRDPSSLLTLYRSLVVLRRSHDALSIGDFTLIDTEDDVLAYVRRYAGECLLIALNLSDQMRPLCLSQSLLQSLLQSLPENTCVAEVLGSTLLPATVVPTELVLRPMDASLAPHEGLILRLKEIR